MNDSVVTLDTLQRALHLVDLAHQFMTESGGDQYSSTFRRADGKLGGRIAFDPKLGEFVVDFGLNGAE